MLLHYLKATFFAVLSLSIGGSSSWAAAFASTPELSSGGPGPGPLAVAAPVPFQTAAPRLPTPSPVQQASDTAAPVAPPAASPGGLAAVEALSSRPAPASVAPPARISAPALEYSPQLIEHFAEIGLNVEYGTAMPALRRWTQEVRIKVHGTPTSEDLRVLRQVVSELNHLVTGVGLRVAGQDSNIDIYFVPESWFATLEPAYVPVNLGFYRVWWDGSGAIYRARILVASQGTTQRERSHIVREELTQSLGLFNDSWKYPDSIFYQGWTDTTEYLELDAAAIRLLYHPSLRPGMLREEVLAVLSTLPGAACCLD